MCLVTYLITSMQKLLSVVFTEGDGVTGEKMYLEVCSTKILYYVLCLIIYVVLKFS